MLTVPSIFGKLENTILRNPNPSLKNPNPSHEF